MLQFAALFQPRLLNSEDEMLATPFIHETAETSEIEVR
jgi:hypothetical protein